MDHHCSVEINLLLNIFHFEHSSFLSKASESTEPYFLRVIIGAALEILQEDVCRCAKMMIMCISNFFWITNVVSTHSNRVIC